MRDAISRILVGAAVVMAVASPCRAQITVPNLNTGDKSNVPYVTSDPRLQTRDGPPPTFRLNRFPPRRRIQGADS